jgi:DNA-binding Lrp family transcriptional regulator
MTLHNVLDDRDRRILYWLDMDARVSNAGLAKRAGLSCEVARYRVRRLERERVIKGYFALIDVTRLGFLSFRTYIKFQGMSSQDEDRFVSYLKAKPEVGWFTFVQGQWDAVVIVWAQDIYGFERFWLDLVQRFGGNIERHWMSIF